MIENKGSRGFGDIALSIVNYGDKKYFISTVNLPAQRLINLLAEWRDDWWEPPFPNETMIWEYKNERRIGEILHCAGYETKEIALKEHNKLCVYLFCYTALLQEAVDNY